MARMSLNRAGPHKRDIQRLLRAAESLGLRADAHTAQTGTVYVEVTDSREGREGERVYRFASHAACYDSHDYSVCSGSTQPSPHTSLPPGYDGWTDCAVIDLATWADQPDAPCARRACAQRDRRIAAIEQERQWRERRDREAREQGERDREAARGAYGLLGRACLRVARQLWPDWRYGEGRHGLGNAVDRVLRATGCEGPVSVRCVCDALEAQ